ncbi:MAG: hypothetical protein ABIC91_02600 [Nanoarchaeota archaeon]|nr:hypothetical protein [Nanoarchaeota archaeon]
MISLLVGEEIVINSIEYDFEREKSTFSSSFSEEMSSFEQIYNLFYPGLSKKDEVYIPISLFSKGDSCFQVIVKHLKENVGLKFSEIAKITNRDPRTIWNAHAQAKDVSLIVCEGDSEINIPVSIICNRKKSVLASIALFLQERDFSIKEISEMLGKHYQTIFTTIRRTKLENE